MRWINLVSFALIVNGLLPAEQPSAPDFRLVSLAKDLYYKAVEGDKRALTQAIKMWNELRVVQPNNATILAYTGSTQLLEASNTMAVWRKGKMSKDGLASLDEAVSRAPHDLEIRFVRAASTYHLPGFFRRRHQSESDFEWLAPQVEAAVASGTLERRLGAAALFHHGLFRSAAADDAGARAAWEKTIQIGGDSRAAKDARNHLDKLRIDHR